MMFRTGRYTYAEGLDWEALALFFRPQKIEGVPGCFLAILPQGNARDFAASLSPEKFDSICKALAAAAPRQVRVGMPRFEQRTATFPLTNALKACGLRKIFTPQADLSDFADAPLYLSEVLQRCYVKADEQGAKAAAVTVGVILSWSARPRSVIPFIMDRPFIWAITDLENSTSPLFMGLFESP
jgi:serpin B